ncbi:hypothetical protein M2350_002113 [Candidatus Fervidibacter sacchari]|uniref:Uncharacterized protein n=1 Tax=Candidatus Fervidibacter sacchari TaxID=1448929 RepID=A0ABT2EP13_9BACT|nr:hypothetical protein [Candidatus Fervidibacter sacchari]
MKGRILLTVAAMKGNDAEKGIGEWFSGEKFGAR